MSTYRKRTYRSQPQSARRTAPQKRRSTYRSRPRRSRDLVAQYPGFSSSRTNSGEEWKYNDNSWNGPTNLPYASPSFQLLNGLVVGTGPNNRIGRQVNVRSIQLAYSVQIPGTSPTFGICRVMCYIDRQCNGVIPTSLVASVLENDPLNLAPRGMDSRKRYKILYDKLHDLSGISTTGLPSIASARWYYKFRRPLDVAYNAGTVGNATDIVTNAIWFVAFFSIASGAQAYAFNRIRYTDN